METKEIIIAFRNIAETLGHVKVEGEPNLDRVLSTIRYSRNMANLLEKQLTETPEIAVTEE